MHHATPLITTIVGGLVLAFILGMIANKLRISPLVGYLLAGVLAGPFTPGFVADTKLAPELAELGVILLMFGVGLHFSLKDLMAVKSIAIPGAIAQIAVATLLGMALSAALGWSLMTGIVFGLCLSTASTVVLLRALEERQLIDSQRGQIAIGWLIVEDLVMVLTLVLLPAIAGMAEKGNVGFASLALDLGITIGKVVAFIAIMMLVGRRLVPWIMSRSAATGSRELFTLSVLALALGIAFGAVELFDVSFALGAFFAGMVLNESELSHRAAHDTLPLRDAFAVLFFVSVGMLFDPMVLVQQPLAVLATLAIIIFGKSAAAFFLVRMFGHSPRTALIPRSRSSSTRVREVSTTTSGIPWAISFSPSRLPTRPKPTNSAWLQISTGTCFSSSRTSSSVCSSRVSVLSRYFSSRVNSTGLSIIEMIAPASTRFCPACGSRLSAIPRPARIKANSPICARLAAMVSAVLGNAANEEIMELAHLDCARWLLLTIPNGYEAGEIVASAREKCPNIEIIARAHYDDEVDYIIDRGANQVVMGEREIARAMLRLLETPPAGEVVTG